MLTRAQGEGGIISPPAAAREFTVYPGWLLAAIAGGFLLSTLAIAVLPARTAATARPSQLLRTE